MSTSSTTSSSDTSTPTLPKGSPWDKQGLNPFASLFSNGQEHVSLTSGLLTVSATDAVIPGRNGMDLVISRYYNSKISSKDIIDEKIKYLPFNWQFGLPVIDEDHSRIYFDNGSVCDLQNNEISKEKDDITIDNLDGKKITYTNSVNRYFKLISYDKVDRYIFGHPVYEPEYYDLLFADGSRYRLNKAGKVEYKVDRTGNNKITFSYNNEGFLKTIKDSAGRYYSINNNESEIKIVRDSDSKYDNNTENMELVTYTLEDELSDTNNNRLSDVIDALERKTVYSYNDKCISTINYPSGKRSIYQYGSVTHESGYRRYYVSEQEIYDNEELIKKIDYRLQTRTEFNKIYVNYISAKTYDQDEKLLNTSYYHANNDGLLIRSKMIDNSNDEIQDKVLRTTYYEYDNNKNKKKEIKYFGNIYENTYDDSLPNNEVAISIEKMNKEDKWKLIEEEWKYDKYGNLRYYKDPEGYETMIAYANTDNNKMFKLIGVGNGGSEAFYEDNLIGTNIHNLPSGKIKLRKKIKNEYGEIYDAQETYYKYDPLGNLVENKSLIITDMETGQYNVLINEFNRYDIFGNLEKAVYDVNNKNIEVNYEYGQEYNYAYMTSKRQEISEHLVDNDGDEIYSKYAVTSFKYDFKTGEQKEITDPQNNTLSYEYDNLGRVKKVSYPILEGETEAAYEEVEYIDDENKVKVYDAERKNLTVHYFDGLGRETKVETYNDINAENFHSEVSKTYNWQNKVETITDENGKVTKNNYDIFGRIKETITDDEIKISYEYDDLARKKIITNPKGVETTIITDKKGQKVEESVDGITNKYQYDGYGNIIKIIDGENKEKVFVYNNRGLLSKTIYPYRYSDGKIANDESGETEYRIYNELGNLIETEDRNGQKITYQYNEYNQITEQYLSSSGEYIDYYYNELGQLVKIEQEDEYKKILKYDNRGRLSDEIITIDGKTYNNHYEYNKNNQLKSQKYPDNKILKNNYNNLNQINNVKWDGRNIISSVDYRNTGHIENISYGNGVDNGYKYRYQSGTYLPYHINYGSNLRYDYSYDILGNITQINDQTYEYDDIGRLANWSYLKENDQVLIGEEILWEKEMDSAEGIDLNKTMISNNQLSLALDPATKDQGLLAANWLKEKDENVHSVETQYMIRGNNEGIYELERRPYLKSLDFTDDIFAGSTDNNHDLAVINSESGELTIPKNDVINQWEPHETDPDKLQLTQKYQAINTLIDHSYLYKIYNLKDYEEKRTWEPSYTDSPKWHFMDSVTIDGSKLKNINKLRIAIKNHMQNAPQSWSLNGYANFTSWLKVEINGIPVGKLKYEAPGSGWGIVGPYLEEVIEKSFTFNLKDKSLMNKSIYHISIYNTVNQWGNGEIMDCYLESIKLTALDKLFYPIDVSEKHTMIVEDLKNTCEYKLETEDIIPADTELTYKLLDENSTYIRELNDGDIFQVDNNGEYQLLTTLKSFNTNETPVVKNKTISKKEIYKDSARIYTNNIDLPDKGSDFEIIAFEEKPYGTDIEYEIGLFNEDTNKYEYVNTTTNVMGRYTANSGISSNKIKIRITLHSDENNLATPIVNGILLVANDAGDYYSSGYLETEDIRVYSSTKTVILELHGKKNSDNTGIDVTLDVDEETYVGVPTTVEEIISTTITEPSGRVAYPQSLDGSDIDDPDLVYTKFQENAMAIQEDISNKDIATHYYKFELDKVDYGSSAKLKINLTPTPDKRSSASVYSYIIYDNYLNYYTEGSFDSANTIQPEKNYKFNKIKFDVNQDNNYGSSSFTVYNYTNNNEINITPGTITQLSEETNSVVLKGDLSTDNGSSSPEIYDVQLTAVGETPLINDLETEEDIYTENGNITISEDDSVIGNNSISINQNGDYDIKGESFNAKKLPIVTLWVKPLNEGSIKFTITDDNGQSRDISSDSNNDTYFDNQDLELNSWNMLRLDLRKLYDGNSIENVTKLTIKNTSGANILVDGVKSLPLNEVVYQYDKAGNRTRYIKNGDSDEYIYIPGTNLLDKKADVNYNYDNNGNLISKSKNNDVYSYDYNELNQLVEVSLNNDLIAEYKYDHSGLRYKKIEYLPNRTKTTIYIYGQGTEPIYEEVYYDGRTSPDKAISYLFMGGKRVARDENGIIIYNYTDHLGSTRAVQRGGNITRLDYAPFGEELTDSSEKYKFTGKEQDVNTGLYYYNARYYDPNVGRFISEDPAKDGINWYSYCSNNPLKYVDPDGMEYLLGHYILDTKYWRTEWKYTIEKGSLGDIVNAGASLSTKPLKIAASAKNEVDYTVKAINEEEYKASNWIIDTVSNIWSYFSNTVTSILAVKDIAPKEIRYNKIMSTWKTLNEEGNLEHSPPANWRDPMDKDVIVESLTKIYEHNDWDKSDLEKVLKNPKTNNVYEKTFGSAPSLIE